MNQGQSLTPYEEEWLDGKGNLVNGEVLIGQLRTLSSTSGDATICVDSSDISTFLEIYDFNTSITGTKKEDKQPAAKEKNKHNPIEKINSEKASAQKSKRKASQKPLTTSQISNASYAEKVQVLDWHHKNGKRQTKTSAHFANALPHLKIKQPLLSKWLKVEDTIRAKHQESSHDSTKWIQTLTYPKFEQALSEWIAQAIHHGLPLSGKIFKEK